MRPTCTTSDCLPAIRPTSSGRPIAPWWVLSSFTASLSLWLMNKKVRNRWRGVNVLYGLYLLHHTNGQMHVCSLHHPLKLLPSAHVLLSCTSQDGFMLRLICMFLGYNWPTHLVLLLKSLSRSTSFIMYWFTPPNMNYITFYVWINRLTCFLPVVYLYSCSFA